MKSYVNHILFASILLMNTQAHARLYVPKNDIEERIQIPKIEPHIKNLILVFHGLNGPDKNTHDLMQELNRIAKENSIVHFVDWTQFKGNTFTAPTHSKKVGEVLARTLNSKSLDKIVAIGISVGSFAANELSKQIKQQNPKIKTQLILLDPFLLLGFNHTYGQRHFGKDAHLCQQILNHDDKVVFTNDKIDACQVDDITDMRPAHVHGHDWPLIYFVQNIEHYIIDL